MFNQANKIFLPEIYMYLSKTNKGRHIFLVQIVAIYFHSKKIMKRSILSDFDRIFKKNQFGRYIRPACANKSNKIYFYSYINSLKTTLQLNVTENSKNCQLWRQIWINISYILLSCLDSGTI